MLPTFLLKWRIILRLLGIYFWSQTFPSRTTAGLFEIGKRLSIIASWSSTQKVLIHCNPNQETAAADNLKSYPHSLGIELSNLEIFQLVADSLQNSTSPLWKGVVCIQEFKGTDTTQIYMPRYYHSYQITDTEVMHHHEMKLLFLLQYKPLSRSRLHLLLDSGWEDKEGSCFQEECLYMELSFPSIADRLTVFILYRNIYIANSFRQSIEIVTTHIFQYFILKQLWPIQKGLSYLVEEQLRVSAA